jgi:hypothetical protein
MEKKQYLDENIQITGENSNSSTKPSSPVVSAMEIEPEEYKPLLCYKNYENEPK